MPKIGTKKAQCRDMREEQQDPVAEFEAKVAALEAQRHALLEPAPYRVIWPRISPPLFWAVWMLT
jgi:hypothetical protein